MSDTLVASLLVLRQKVHSFHWMVTGISFHELHLLAAEQYAAILEYADRVAEYMRTLNMLPPTTLTEIVSLSIIDDSDTTLSPRQMIEILSEDFLLIANYINEIPDESRALANILDDMHEYLMKQHWFLRSFLE